MMFHGRNRIWWNRAFDSIRHKRSGIRRGASSTFTKSIGFCLSPQIHRPSQLVPMPPWNSIHKMRPLEWLITCTSILGTVWFLVPHESSSTLWFAIAAAVLFLLHAWHEGVHWQMIPAYLALPFTWLIGATTILGVRVSCAIFAAVMVAASLVLSWALPMFKLPVPTGKYPVGTRMLYLTDPNRPEMHEGARPGNREVITQLWYPAATARGRRALYRRKKETSFRSSYQAVLKTHSLQDAPVAAGRFPVIVHNCGWWNFRSRLTYLFQDLASHGFVVVSVSHPYNSSMVELADGSVVNPDMSLDLGFSFARYIPLQERFAIADAELAIQTADCRFVLDELEKLDRTPGNPFESRLDMKRVGATGHSFGGAVAVELAREDARVQVAVELDGVLHGAAAAHGLNKPVLLIDAPWMLSPGKYTDLWAPETLDKTVKAETAQLWDTVAEAKARMLEISGGVQMIVKGLGHHDFMDQIFMSPLRRLSKAESLAPKRVARIVTTYVLAFLEQTLRDKPTSLFTPGPADFQEVTVLEPRATFRQAEA
jgi:dienelactone hydrolase